MVGGCDDGRLCILSVRRARQKITPPTSSPESPNARNRRVIVSGRAGDGCPDSVDGGDGAGREYVDASAIRRAARRCRGRGDGVVMRVPMLVLHRLVNM